MCRRLQLLGVVNCGDYRYFLRQGFVASEGVAELMLFEKGSIGVSDLMEMAEYL